MKAATPWYTLAKWARENDWVSGCHALDHICFHKADNSIEVSLENGRMTTAEWHCHANDDCHVVKTASNTYSTYVDIEQWFKE